jgi:hypothetical protein
VIVHAKPRFSAAPSDTLAALNGSSDNENICAHEQTIRLLLDLLDRLGESDRKNRLIHLQAMAHVQTLKKLVDQLDRRQKSRQVAREAVVSLAWLEPIAARYGMASISVGDSTAARMHNSMHS